MILGYFPKLKWGREQQSLENPLLINEIKFDSIAVIIFVRSRDTRVMANYMGQCYALHPT